VEIDEARRHEQPVGIEFPPAALVHLTHGHDAVAVDRHVAGPGRRPAPVHDGSAPDHEVVHGGDSIHRTKEVNVAVAIYFHPPTLNEQQYRTVVDQLEKDGKWPPAGLVHHSCFGEGDGLMVYEVWESQERLDEFGQRLRPALQEHQVEPGQVQVMPVVNLVP